jgi:hypothetical protein
VAYFIQKQLENENAEEILIEERKAARVKRLREKRQKAQARKARREQDRHVRRSFR